MSCKNLSSARLCPQALPVTNIRHVHWKKWIPPFFPAKKILQIQKNTPKVQKDMYKCWTKRNLSVTQSLSVDTFPISVCPIISKWCLFYPFTPVITVGNLDTGNCMFRGHLRVFVGHFHNKVAMWSLYDPGVWSMGVSEWVQEVFETWLMWLWPMKIPTQY